MVAYKKLTKDERLTVAAKLGKKRMEKEIYPSIKKIENTINDEYMKHVPDEVIAFSAKYPKTLKPTKISIYGWYFLTKEMKDTCNNNRYSFNWPDFHINQYYPGCLGFDDENVYINDSKIVNWIKESIPNTYEDILNILRKVIVINEFKNNVYCALSKITTLNKLKSEFPEAYDAYIQYYGGPSTPCKKDKNQNVCDTIEKLRAEYNN